MDVNFSSALETCGRKSALNPAHNNSTCGPRGFVMKSFSNPEAKAWPLSPWFLLVLTLIARISACSDPETSLPSQPTSMCMPSPYQTHVTDALGIDPC